MKTVFKFELYNLGVWISLHCSTLFLCSCLV